VLMTDAEYLFVYCNTSGWKNLKKKVVLSEAEIHVPNGVLVGTTECVTLKLRYHTNRGRYNRV